MMSNSSNSAPEEIQVMSGRTNSTQQDDSRTHSYSDSDEMERTVVKVTY